MKKKIFLIALLLFLIRQASFPQTYIPLPDSNTQWHLEYYIISPPQFACPGPPYGFCYSYSCQIFKDTIVNGYIYHMTDCPVFAGYPFYGSMFRQDTVAKKVYLLSTGSPVVPDTLLYDFDLKVGDTLKQWEPSNIWNVPRIVTAIDSIYNGLIYLKVWIIDNNPDQYFIESIGSPYGLFNGTIFFESGSLLKCMTFNGQVYYPDVSQACSVLTTRENRDESEVFLSPNPVQQFSDITFKSGIPNTKNILIRVFDIAGKQLDQLRGDNIQNISRFNPGIYFIEISVSSQKHIQKLIIC